MIATPDWTGASGDIWAQRWQETDRALEPVGAALDAAIRRLAPLGPLRALDVGCGPGTTALALAAERPDATVLGCDLSAALVAVARRRAAGIASLRFLAEDAETAAREHGPFDLIQSRHGVMFFADPRRAFAALRAAAAPGGRLVFSCFREWSANTWAVVPAEAAAGKALPPPGREPSGFAFADVDYVRDILADTGWTDAAPAALDFDYVAGAVEQAVDFLAELGPAARVIEGMEVAERAAARARMRQAIIRHAARGEVTFPAAAWIWTARAG